MRLLHVTHQYRPAIGGAEKYIADLSQELASRGHTVDVYTSRSKDYRTWRTELPPFERLDGVNVYRFRSLPRGKWGWRSLSYGLRHYWPSEARRYEPFLYYGNGPVCPGMLAAILRRGRSYDAVHINHLHYSHSLAGFLGARMRGLPLVITPHIHVEVPLTFDVGYLRDILRGSDGILADTPFEKEFLCEREWNPNITVAGVGLAMKQFPPLDTAACRSQFGLPADGFVILFLGRKTEYKGLDLCLAAFAELRKQRRDIYLLAAGPETDFSAQLWQRYAGMEGLKVYGAVSDEQRLAALAGSDVLVMPSTGEAFGIVYLEAWAYSKPVIAADIPTIASIISDGQDGFLVKPGQAGQLVERLAGLADNAMLARAMGVRGRARLERRYTLEHIADIVEGACARAIRHRKRLSHYKGV